MSVPRNGTRSLLLSKRASRLQRFGSLAGHGALLAVTSSSVLAVLFIFYFIAKDALPFLSAHGLKELLGSLEWYPSGHPPAFGALSIFVGSALVTVGAIIVAVPLGIATAVCLSDVLPFRARQYVKPVIEMLAAIPSVAYGFFALVVFAPLLQESGGAVLAAAGWLVGAPLAGLAVVVLSELATARCRESRQPVARWSVAAVLAIAAFLALRWATGALAGLTIPSGTNALNVSVILGIMALPTIVSVSEDALQAVGRELREGSYALGATRAETIVRVVIPAASSGLGAAVILGIMRAIGDTMVVWMASGNASQIPKPWYDLTQPVRTLTATIAGDMGEADHVTGSDRYSVLFVLAIGLLIVCFILNLLSELAVRRTKRKMGR